MADRRERAEALLFRIHRSRLAFEGRFKARAEVLARRYQIHRLAEAYRQYRKRVPYPPRRPDREEGWRTGRMVLVPEEGDWL